MVLKVSKWEDMEFDGQEPLASIIKVQREEGHYGYCPVFTDYEQALDAAGDAERVIAIRTIEGGDKQ